MVPVRALWSLLWWIIQQINTWGGILISIPLIPLIWFFVMAAKGARRVSRMIKRALSPSDHVLSEVVADEAGWIYGQVDGDTTAFGLFAELHVEARLIREGMVLRDRTGKTFLVTSFEVGQKPAPLANLLAESFLRE
ncbi:Hypothetical protein PPUBIRD1_1907 [Pseudomonas putida BIRD-1]|jgi:hypothetical protein|nr:Hypothetical protein PPUBIRD1_1907 [Pseudomonas putida BIRD-1]